MAGDRFVGRVRGAADRRSRTQEDLMSTSYLLAPSTDEQQRLRLQSLVWEDAGRRAADRLRATAPRRAADLGCGALGWLRVLAELVGPDGDVVGTDHDPAMLAAAEAFVPAAALPAVRLQLDDVFASQLPARRFDVVHARF